MVSFLQNEFFKYSHYIKECATLRKKLENNTLQIAFFSTGKFKRNLSLTALMHKTIDKVAEPVQFFNQFQDT